MFFNLKHFIYCLQQYSHACVHSLYNITSLDIQGVMVDIYWKQYVLDDKFYVQIGIHAPEDNNIIHWFSTPGVYTGQDMTNIDESIDNAVRAIANLGVFNKLIKDSLGTL